MNKEMTTQEAILYILEHDKSANKYRLSKALNCSNTTIHNYTKGKAVMSDTIFEAFTAVYPDIRITDLYIAESKRYKLGTLQ